ncbi:MAG: electron transport complex subunit RsxB [Granulosicoccus sp.]
MTDALAAIALMVVIMACVGYALSHLSLPTRASTRKNASTDDASMALHDESANETLIEEVNRRLPQTQCAQCGHPGCRPYATAIINDSAPINQCPPGGEALIEELAILLGTQALPLDSDKGQTKPAQVALIVEPDCIGCTLCIAACPVDAIVGASRLMHTVIADQCTGCELCLPPCPVDCIELLTLEMPLHRWQWPKPS